jgi:hypothetical protein
MDSISNLLKSADKILQSFEVGENSKLSDIEKITVLKMAHTNLELYVQMKTMGILMAKTFENMDGKK